MLSGIKILTISGWAQPADALRLLAPHADYVDYVDSPSFLDVAELCQGKQYDMIIGWSLGGVIARQLLSHQFIDASALVLLSTPYQFVADDHMSHAMGPTTFEQFYDSYAKDPERTSARFHGLVAKGDAREREVMRGLGHHEQVLNADKWLPWLERLRDYSSAEQTYKLPPTFMVHGKHDAIVPHHQAEKLATTLNAELLTLEHASHAPHLHDVDELRRHIADFYSRVLRD